MRLGSNALFALLASVLLLSFTTGCRGAQKQPQAPETNPWADYKGTYAQDMPPATTKPKRIAQASSAAPKGDDEEKTDRPAKVGAKPKPKKGNKKGAAAAAATAPAEEPASTNSTPSTTAAEPRPNPDDARSMYGLERDPKPHDTAAQAKKLSKKRTAGGKKGGGTKASAAK
jgi:hypothetical protein